MKVVLYHAECMDGFCAAWAASTVLGRGPEFVPVKYGEPPPALEAGSDVYILDFCYPRDVLEDIARRSDFLTLLDHHKTAEGQLRGLRLPNARVQFSSTRSGARMAWDFFRGGEPPWTVKYVEDRDLWRWALSDSRAVNAFLGTAPFDFDFWDVLAATEVGSQGWIHVLTAGRAVGRSDEKWVDRVVKGAQFKTYDGRRVVSVNSPVLQSEVGERLAAGAAFVAVWCVGADGRYYYSLRSDAGGEDVAKVAEIHGGGGHARVAGFSSEVRVW